MTQTQRIARAKEAIEAHKAVYYKDGGYDRADFWDYAEIFEIIDDMYQITGDPDYRVQIEEMYQFVLRTYKETWEYNPYNDDIMWLVIALTRATLLTGEQKYVQMAKVNYDLTYARAWDETYFDGGLWWKQDEKRSKNSCVNCPGAIAACLLGQALSDESYFDKAKQIMAWQNKVLTNPAEGKVYDCVNLEGKYNYWSSTYNQGTYIGANCLLHAHTGEEAYKLNAERAAAYTMNEMYQGGIMNNEEWGNDLPGFKGIMSRWIRLFALTYDRPEYLEWLQKNADSAYANKNSKGLMQTKLGEQTEEIEYDVFTCSAAVAVCVNAI